MINKKLFFATLFFLSVSFSISAQHFTSDILKEKWKLVNELIEQGLPESAISTLNTMKPIAENANLIQDKIKIEMHRYRLELEKNRDKWQSILKDSESWINSLNESPEKSIALFLLSDFYQKYYLDNRFKIDNRTNIQYEQLSDDISTWTTRNFKTKINQIQELALSNKTVLQNSKTTDFVTLLNFNQETHLLTPTIYDVLMHHRIASMSNLNETELLEKTYQDLFNFRRSSSDRSLLVHLDLKYHSRNFRQLPDKSNLQTLDSLEQLYHNLPEVVEIMHAKAEWFMRQENISGNKRIAYRICEEGISKFPNYFRIHLLTNMQFLITEKKLNMSHPSVIGRNKNLDINFNTTNIRKLILEIHRINASPMDIERSRYLPDDLKDSILQKKLVDVRIINIPYNPDFEQTDTIFSVQLPGYGNYQLIAYPQKSYASRNTASGILTVSDLTYMTRALDKHRAGIYVLDRFSGKTIRGAKVTLFETIWDGNQYKSNIIANKVTDKNGYAEFARPENFRSVYFNVAKGSDLHLSSLNFSIYSEQNNSKSDIKPLVSIFTDRKVYRPGQTIFFKAISYFSNEEMEKVNPNADITITLFDANGNKISSKNLKTNEFGSASSEFIIPNAGLNGTWYLAVDKFQTNILVEEYKIPTFEVLFSKPTQAIRFNHEITVDAQVKTFAGYVLPGSTVRYRIHRITHPFWRFFPRTQEVLVESGEVNTNSFGKFSISFIPEKDNNFSESRWGFHSYIYRITTDVTDLRGETQQGILEIPVSEQSVFVQVKMESMIVKQNNYKVDVNVHNILGENINTQMFYYLEGLAETDEYDEIISKKSNFIFHVNDTVLRGKFHSSQKSIVLNLSKLPVGRYRLIIKTIDNTGFEISNEQLFVLYNPKDRRPAVKSYIWATENNIESKPGENIDIQFGTSVNKAHILMEVMSGNKTVSSRWINMCNSIRTFKVTYKEEYKDGLTVNFSFVRDEQLFVQSFVIQEKKQTKSITPQLNVFRDKLSPGEQSEWSVTIPDAGLKTAELMLSMFDASLQIFAQHEWIFNPNFSRSIIKSPQWSGIPNQRVTGFASYIRQFREIPHLEIALPNSFGFEYNLGLNLFHRRHMLLRSTLATDNTDIETAHDFQSIDIATLSKSTGLESESVVNQTRNESLSSFTTPTSTIRSNFNETAFFYPQVYADISGNYRFSFTIPESLTRWNLKMLAHTKDLYHGQAQATVITTKDLMVRLNKPRFVRESDETVLSASVINLSDSVLSTKVYLRLTDTRDNNEIMIASAKEQIVELLPGESKTLHWNIGKLKNRRLIICTVEAISDLFSDGEQHYLVILPDRVLVTESQPFSIIGNSPATITFDEWKMKSGEKDTHAVSLEFSSNPLWHAIQALPVLAETQSENSIDLFMQWFARMKALQILNKNPEITEIFKMLEASGKSVELSSPLTKNEDLKNFLLQETPWVNVARNETEAIQRIRLLFDKNHQNQEVKKFFDLLAARQMSNGAFAWYPGMQENRWISQSIAEGITHIYQSRSANQEEKRLINKLLDYLDSELRRDYETIKRNHRDYLTAMYINPLQLQYLVIRTFFSEYERQPQHVESFEYFLRQAEIHHRKFDIHDKALAAKVLHRAKRTETSKNLLNSLRETAVKSKEKGMFWTANKSGVSWNEQPISVHASIMRAFEEISGENADLDMMKIWLINQKHTQHWGSPIASLHAIAALTSSANKITIRNPVYQIKINDKAINENHNNLGTGYIRFNINNQIIPESITVIPAAETLPGSIARGAVYWQYFSDIDKLTSSGHELRVSKTYFAEQIVNNQRQLVELDRLTARALRPGNRIVTRLVVTTDRDLDFVALKDLRASCLEPENNTSTTMWNEGVVYYRTVKDASTQYFFQTLPKGSYVFEDAYFITNSGDFSGGMVSVQCLYAPEFKAHYGAQRLVIK